MNINLTKDKAQEILRYTEYQDYIITDLYEDSFRAYRQNDYMVSELNCEVFSDIKHINSDTVNDLTSICIHVLRRFK